jgi:hypothetical protein
MTKMIAPENATSLGWNGEVFEVKRGRVDVPDAAIPDALHFGYTLASEKPEKAAEAPVETPVEAAADAPAVEG